MFCHISYETCAGIQRQISATGYKTLIATVQKHHAHIEWAETRRNLSSQVKLMMLAGFHDWVLHVLVKNSCAPVSQQPRGSGGRRLRGAGEFGPCCLCRFCKPTIAEEEAHPEQITGSPHFRIKRLLRVLSRLAWMIQSNPESSPRSHFHCTHSQTGLSLWGNQHTLIRPGESGRWAITAGSRSVRGQAKSRVYHFVESDSVVRGPGRLAAWVRKRLDDNPNHRFHLAAAACCSLLPPVFHANPSPAQDPKLCAACMNCGGPEISHSQVLAIWPK